MHIQTELPGVFMEKTMRFHFRFSELGISKADVINLLSESNGLLPGLFLDYIDEIIGLADEGCRISGYVRIYSKIELDSESSILTIEDKEFQVSKIIAGQIKESTQIAVFVCTAGSFLEDYARQQMRTGNYPEAFIADHLGSFVVETAMNNIQEQLRVGLLNENLRITNRFSPGYCGWNVSGQHNLFKLIPEGECGIHLTSSALMQPIKSISGIIGIGERVKQKEYFCHLCNMQGCIYRDRKKQG